MGPCRAGRRSPSRRRGWFRRALGASAQDTQWILDSYILVFAGLLLTSGSLSDRFGRRKVMIIGLALFGIASLVATFAASPGELIAARVVMGWAAPWCCRARCRSSSPSSTMPSDRKADAAETAPEEELTAGH